MDIVLIVLIIAITIMYIAARVSDVLIEKYKNINKEKKGE